MHDQTTVQATPAHFHEYYDFVPLATYWCMRCMRCMYAMPVTMSTTTACLSLPTGACDACVVCDTACERCDACETDGCHHVRAVCSLNQVRIQDVWHGGDGRLICNT